MKVLAVHPRFDWTYIAYKQCHTDSLAIEWHICQTFWVYLLQNVTVLLPDDQLNCSMFGGTSTLCKLWCPQQQLDILALKLCIYARPEWPIAVSHFFTLRSLLAHDISNKMKDEFMAGYLRVVPGGGGEGGSHIGTVRVCATRCFFFFFFFFFLFVLFCFVLFCLGSS